MRPSSGRRARRLAAGLGAATALVAAGVTINSLTASGGPPPSGALKVTGPLNGSPGTYVRGSGLYAGGGRAALSASVSAPLDGPLSPAAVASPDGRYVAYNSWRALRPVDQEPSNSDQGIRDGEALGLPSIRLYDTVTGRDTVLEQGTTSLAWRADGAVAYVRGVDPTFRAGGDYLGHIVVRASARGRAVGWTGEPARYVVYAWAGDRLVAYRIGAGEHIETIVLDGPGHVRTLAEGAVVALSPDGVFALVVDGRTLRLLSVADGSESAQLELESEIGAPSYSGSWKGDLVAAAAHPGIVVFHVQPGSIAVEQELALDAAQFPVGVQEPELVGDAGNEIVATAEVPPQNGNPALNLLLACDRVTRTCERGDAAPAADWVRLVRDPSRPQKGDR